VIPRDWLSFADSHNGAQFYRRDRFEAMPLGWLG